MSVSVVIVNWNSGSMLRACLKSLAEDRPRATRIEEVIVVDNGSTDDSLSEVEAAAGEQRLVLIRNQANLGFAAACNEGANQVSGSLILFLNPDCRVLPGSIDACSSALGRDPSVGVAGVALLSDSGEVSRSCHRFPTLRDFLFRLSGLSALSGRFGDGSMREWPHDLDRHVDHVIGAFYMVRTGEFRAIGGFDERFFVYLEDLDLSFRYWQKGQRCMFLASSPSYHKGGGTSEQVRAVRLFYAARSRILYAFKHFKAFHAWIHCVATLVIEPFVRLVRSLAETQPRSAGEVLRAFGMLYRDLPATLRLARQK